ncbi:sigma-70 family RNA polymerase sigma factor [Pseudonocardia sp. CA-107938]|uniref:sigma-70 family RNA polymerase sigma factor n=1 Tax=Pseudonocardia sp. CA-107938 TaxID=3240021 RepID=UPI003D8C05A5
MQDEDFWLDRFEEHRPRLRAVAYRMLGSHAEADDALQETWLRISRASGREVENVAGWLTTIVSRQCLNMLRARSTRREEALDTHVPDPVVSDGPAGDPAEQNALADTVGIALLVVLDSLEPAERLAFVLHDMFGLPFEDIAPLVERTPAAARQLASRARRRVQGRSLDGRPDPVRQRAVVDAWAAASRAGDFEGLLSLLHPDAVLRVDAGAGSPLSRLVRGAAQIAGSAVAFRRIGAVDARIALVNGLPGIVTSMHGRVVSVLAFTVVDGLVTEIDILNDRERLAALGIS